MQNLLSDVLFGCQKHDKPAYYGLGDVLPEHVANPRPLAAVPNLPIDEENDDTQANLLDSLKAMIESAAKSGGQDTPVKLELQQPKKQPPTIYLFEVCFKAKPDKSYW